MLWQRVLGLSGEDQPPAGAANALMGYVRWDLVPFFAQLHLLMRNPADEIWHRRRQDKNLA